MAFLFQQIEMTVNRLRIVYRFPSCNFIGIRVIICFRVSCLHIFVIKQIGLPPRCSSIAIVLITSMITDNLDPTQSYYH